MGAGKTLCMPHLPGLHTSPWGSLAPAAKTECDLSAPTRAAATCCHGDAVQPPAMESKPNLAHGAGKALLQPVATNFYGACSHSSLFISVQTLPVLRELCLISTPCFHTSLCKTAHLAPHLGPFLISI